MAQRAELAAAYRYLARRMSAALTTGEQHPVDTPGRRIGLALLAGGVVAMALFAGVSLSVASRSQPSVEPPSQPWQYEGAYVIEWESGSRYVLLDRRLHPVPNYTSVRLVVGRPDLTPEYVARADLADLPRGPRLGIVGAPEELPESSALLTDLGPDTPITVPTGRAALVRADGTYYLLTDGLKYPLGRGAGGDALTALGYAKVSPIELPAAQLDTVSTGPTLDPSSARSSLGGS